MFKTKTEIPYGNFRIALFGTNYTKFAMPQTIDMLVSLTPRCKYQEKEGWPEVGSINVNALGSKKTTRDNWIGYIPAKYAKRFLELMKRNILTAHVSVEGQTVFLQIPVDYLPEDQRLERFTVPDSKFVSSYLVESVVIHNPRFVLIDRGKNKKPSIGLHDGQTIVFEVLPGAGCYDGLKRYVNREIDLLRVNHEPSKFGDTFCRDLEIRI